MIFSKNCPLLDIVLLHVFEIQTRERECTVQYRHQVLYSTVQTPGSVQYSTDTRVCTVQYRHQGLYSTVQTPGSVQYSTDTRVCSCITTGTFHNEVLPSRFHANLSVMEAINSTKLGRLIHVGTHPSIKLSHSILCHSFSSSVLYSPFSILHSQSSVLVCLSSIHHSLSSVLHSPSSIMFIPMVPSERNKGLQMDFASFFFFSFTSFSISN